MKSDDDNTFSEDTWLTHAGRDPDAYFGIVNPPIARASTILYPNLEAFENPDHRYRYAREGSPISDAFETTMAKLEGGFGAVTSPSGLTALTMTLQAFTKAGDHILICDSVYPPMRFYARDMLSKFGIEVEFYDPQIGGAIERLIRPNTALIHMESPGSATFEVQDIPAITAVAKKHGVVTMADNSWGSGILFKPLSHGVDISVLACTKYIGGHADVNLGVAIARNEAVYKRLRASAKHLGMCAAPEDLYLALRGLRSLKLRMAKNEENATAVIEFLKTRDEIQQIFYPALESHPGHDIWKRDCCGAGGLLSILLKPAPKKAVHQFVDGLKLFPIGASWGGYESLAYPQFMKSIRSAVPWERDGFMLRLQIGFEDPFDLIADLKAGLERLNAPD